MTRPVPALRSASGRSTLRRLSLLLAGAAIALDGSAVPAVSGPQGEVHDEALLLFVVYRGHLEVPIHPTELRRDASARIATTLAEHGRSSVTAPALEPWLRRARVRSERDLSLRFLGEIAEEFGVRTVGVWKLVTYDDRIVLLGRGVDPDTGRLESAAAAEAVDESGPWVNAEDVGARLNELIGRAARELAAAPFTPPAEPARSLVALPLLPSGVGRGEADLAWQALLGALLEAGPWSVPDPSLVVNEMQRGGFDPRHLSMDARRHLATAFSARELLIPRVTAFPRPGARSAFAAFDDDFAPRSSELDRRIPVFFTLSLVDAASGRAIAGCGRYLPAEDPLGLFGRSRNTPLTRRYEEGANHLVRALLHTEGAG